MQLTVDWLSNLIHTNILNSKQRYVWNPNCWKIGYHFIKKLEDKSNYNNQTEIEKKVYGINDVQKIPEFGGGLVGFYKFIAQNYKTPDEEGLKGEVLVTFTVDIDGSLIDIKVIKDLGYGTGKEAIRVLKICPKWIPASQNNIPVRCQYSLPINIKT